MHALQVLGRVGGTVVYGCNGHAFEAHDGRANLGKALYGNFLCLWKNCTVLAVPVNSEAVLNTSCSGVADNDRFSATGR